MNRRSFLKRAVGVVFGSLALFYCPSLLEEAVPESLKLGWVVYEEVGIVLVNNAAINRIEVGCPREGKRRER